jgi:hypothetical protein
MCRQGVLWIAVTRLVESSVREMVLKLRDHGDAGQLSSCASFRPWELPLTNLLPACGADLSGRQSVRCPGYNAVHRLRSFSVHDESVLSSWVSRTFPPEKPDFGRFPGGYVHFCRSPVFIAWPDVLVPMKSFPGSFPESGHGFPV